MVARIRVPLTAFERALAAQGDRALADRLLRALGGTAPAIQTTPGWAKQSDRKIGTSHRFVCQGEGKNAEEAMSTARGFCEDKICKLCGVEVESVVQSKETLTGVELSRQVVERCRRVRTRPVKVVRQSLDCPRGGKCYAWVEIEYPKTQQVQECRAYADEQFADPAECERLIERFKKTRGYSALSFRARINLLERAQGACADIDVRPTPLLNALSEKLRRGMNTFTDEEGRVPRYLSSHWIAPHPPLWSAYEESTTFTGKIELLLGYLRSKPPILDVIEASSQPVEQLDTDEGFRSLLALLRTTPVDHGYDRSSVHFFALDRVRSLHRANMFKQPLDGLWAVMADKYGPSALDGWDQLSAMVWLAGADERITAPEWDLLTKVPRWWARAAQIMLEVEDHGRAGTRRRRFEAVLGRAPDGSKSRASTFDGAGCASGSADFAIHLGRRERPAGARAGGDILIRQTEGPL